MTLFKYSFPSVCAVAFAVAVIVPSAPAAAQQDVRPLLERMERLERDINTLQRQVYRGGGAPAQGAAGQQGFAELPGDVAGRMQVRMSELERLVQELTGRVEEVQFQTRQVNERLEQFIKDTDFRLNELQGNAPMAGGGAAAGGEATAASTMPTAPAGTDMGVPAGAGTGQGVLGVMPGGSAGAAASGRPAAATAPAAASPPPGATPREQYDYAFALLRKGDYPAAEQALSGFLRAHPQDELAGNAQYWLGETHYVRGELQKAAVAFLDGYRTYPKNSKAPDNLLKLGITMGRLGQTKEACAALGRMISEYPQAADVLKRRASTERETLGCK